MAHGYDNATEGIRKSSNTSSVGISKSLVGSSKRSTLGALISNFKKVQSTTLTTR